MRCTRTCGRAANANNSRSRHEIDPARHDPRDARDLRGMVAIATTYPPAARFMTFVVGIPAIGLCLFATRGSISIAAARARPTRPPRWSGAGPGRPRAGRGVQFEMPSENAMFAAADVDHAREVRPRDHGLGLFPRSDRMRAAVRLPHRVPVFLMVFLRFQAGPLAQRHTLRRHRRARHVCAVREGIAGFAAYRLRHRICRTAQRLNAFLRDNLQLQIRPS